MINMLSDALLKKEDSLSVLEGLKYALVAIALVFVVLSIIILICYLVNRVLKTTRAEVNDNLINDVDDQEKMAAILTATIEYRKEVKKDIRVVSVKEIK